MFNAGFHLSRMAMPGLDNCRAQRMIRLSRKVAALSHPELLAQDALVQAVAGIMQDHDVGRAVERSSAISALWTERIAFTGGTLSKLIQMSLFYCQDSQDSISGKSIADAKSFRCADAFFEIRGD
jgi:hypothetical protein